MEKIKVNMSPNPLDVQTIHASQNDGEARQWEFELHNNGELIDTSDVTEQLVFKAYKGGTEQILPENGSTPTTSPFLGDIKYPQGLLSDQEFLYRQSPTEEDGLAWIKNIKGNTLVWNQLVQNGNFESASGWSGVRGTISVSNSICSYTITEVGSIATGNRLNRNSVLSNNHNYLISCEVKAPYNNVINASTSNNESLVALSPPPTPNVWTRVSGFMTKNSTYDSLFIGFDASSNYSVGDVVQFRNVMVIDLTQMGLDISSPSEFTSLFTLPYYAYNQGTLLSFNGNGIKTVGKNQLEMPSSATLNGLSFNVGIDGQIQITGTATAQTDFYLYGASGRYDDMDIISSTYTFSCRKDSTTTGLKFFLVGQQAGTRIGVNLDNTSLSQTVTLDGSDKYRVFMRVANGTTINTKVALQLEFGSTATDYEPYTSSTLSLPISTYFPTGMKSAGNVYDELTETKAITRIGSVDLGSLTWSYRTSGSVLAPYFMASFSGIKSQGSPSTNKANMICSKYQTVKRDPTYFIDKTICADGDITTLTQIQIKDSSFTDVTAFKESLQGVYLYYEMVNETETSFTTASLVTENAEIPLSNEDGVLIGKCTEQLSSESGFFDAKIKLADEDGECYSNKIQLHIERSPQ